MKGEGILWAVILGLSIIISAGIGSYAFYQVKSLENTLSVTGSTRVRVTSDIVRWVGVFSRNIPEDSLSKGYQQISRDLDKVLEFYKENGIDTKDLIISPVSVEQFMDIQPRCS